MPEPLWSELPGPGMVPACPAQRPGSRNKDEARKYESFAISTFWGSGGEFVFLRKVFNDETQLGCIKNHILAL